MFNLRSLLAATFVGAASVAAAPQTTGAAGAACNNSPSLCSRPYNTITHMGAHDAAFLRDASTQNSIAGNQYKNATVALDAGLRLLQAQVHKSDNALRLCHTSCQLLDAGPLQNWLAAINVWMTKNPNEVVTIILVNSDSASASELGAVFQQSGISKYGYTPAGSTATGNWPTLQTMINQNTRLVSYVTNAKYDSSVPYLLPEFNYVFETPFEVTSLDGFNCSLDRPKALGTSGASAVSQNYLSLVNHFKYQQLLAGVLVPDTDQLSIVNSPETSTAGNLGLHLKNCQSEWGARPNYVLVDFWSQENPLAAADALNGVSDFAGRKITTEATSKATEQFQGMAKGALLAFCAAALLIL